MYLADGAGEGRVLAHLHRDVLHVVHEPRLHPRAHCGQNSFFLYFKNVDKETLNATVIIDLTIVSKIFLETVKYF